MEKSPFFLELMLHLALISILVIDIEHTSEILLFQNSETAAMLVSPSDPVGVKPFSYVKVFFCSMNFQSCRPHD